MNQYQVTAVCLSRDDQQVMSGGIDNEIKVFDVRKLDLAFSMPGHTDTVTGAAFCMVQRGPQSQTRRSVRVVSRYPSCLLAKLLLYEFRILP